MKQKKLTPSLRESAALCFNSGGNRFLLTRCQWFMGAGMSNPENLDLQNVTLGVQRAIMVTMQLPAWRRIFSTKMPIKAETDSTFAGFWALLLCWGYIFQIWNRVPSQPQIKPVTCSKATVVSIEGYSGCKLKSAHTDWNTFGLVTDFCCCAPLGMWIVQGLLPMDDFFWSSIKKQNQNGGNWMQFASQLFSLVHMHMLRDKIGINKA